MTRTAEYRRNQTSSIRQKPLGGQTRGHDFSLGRPPAPRPHPGVVGDHTPPHKSPTKKLTNGHEITQKNVPYYFEHKPQWLSHSALWRSHSALWRSHSALWRSHSALWRSHSALWQRPSATATYVQNNAVIKIRKPFRSQLCRERRGNPQDSTRT
jgi:hypothetical protein